MTSPQPGRGETAAAEAFGPRILALADHLARFTDTASGLACTYLSPAHREVAIELRKGMQAAGMETQIDAVGNVVGRYAGSDPAARTLILGSHYDTVLNAGKYDGRLGILAVLVVIDALNRQGRRLPYNVELIAFCEEEGVRFSTPYIGSRAVTGRFDPALLDRRDAKGARMADAMRDAGLRPDAIASLARRPEDLIGYLELHIEQGPVLLEEGLPVGIVTAIAGCLRFAVTVDGVAGHAGTVPMTMRHDAAAAEIVLAIERRASAAPTLVGTVGRLIVPNGAINVIPGRCEFTLDLRAGDDATRGAAMDDIRNDIAAIAARRGVKVEMTETLRTPAVRCAPAIQRALAESVARIGVTPRFLPSGAGHDAVMFDGVCDLGMLFVRCGNGGISHSPLETVTAEDANIAAHVLLDFLLHLKDDHVAA